jgi:Tol biopolymer transport system component
MLPGPQLWAAPFSLHALKLTGESFPVANSQFVFGVSTDDTLVYLERGTAVRQLCLRDRSGRKTGVVDLLQDWLSDLALSPDGRRVAVSAGEGSAQEIWVHEVARRVKTRVTFSSGANTLVSNAAPVWSASGDRIAFSAFRASQDLAQSSIRSKSADGTGEEVELVGGKGFRRPTDWSGDGRTLLYDELDSSFTTVISSWLDLTHSPPAVHSAAMTPSFSERQGRLSPDGKYLAYSSNESGRYEVYVRQFPQGGGKQQISSAGGAQPRWRRDGRELFYLEQNALMAVPVTIRPKAISFGAPQKLFALERGWNAGYDVSADGKQVVTAEPAEGSRPPAIRVVQHWSAAFRDHPSEPK